ncbi:hypothetical protein GNI_068780 [Gregarina niphandrodes]|uniref:Uncharacterized protein n=1 Tax=Gregarina niphandrodes TaxID=110365 RepID=A0A023B7I8_GRENI|nr:hypothetical protein GNI_068780 [Gregarina niphandrodes]EZG67402.1 hypothetical protein GNI_068780 [Gregarina niphandrodes]|eukprot:XP_011130236.1 hypothetical protein GNI_068780 [Gregarina niphandrodes]
MACLLPAVPVSQTQNITADNLNTEYVKSVDFDKERRKPEVPPLEMDRRTFALTSVTDFEWVVLVDGKTNVAKKVDSSAIANLLFTLRSFRVPENAMRRRRRLSTNTARTPNAQRRSSITPIASAFSAPPAGQRKVSVPPDSPRYPRRTSLAEIMVSRAIELEAYYRSSETTELGLQPVNCWFADEIAELPKLGSIVRPATYGPPRPDSSKIQIKVSVSCPVSVTSGYQTLFNGVLHNGVLHNGVLHNGVLHNGVLHNGVLHNGVLHNGVLHNGVLHNGVLHNGVLHNGVLVWMVSRVIGGECEAVGFERVAVVVGRDNKCRGCECVYAFRGGTKFDECAYSGRGRRGES